MTSNNTKKTSWKTRLTAPPPPSLHNASTFKSLVTPVYRGSTVLFSRVEDVIDDWRQKTEGWKYGLYGTPTAVELSTRIAYLEDSYHTFLVPGGQSAICLVYFAICKSGSHVLIPDSVYSPHRDLSEQVARFNIQVDTYNPTIGGDIEKLIKPNTTLIWCESPCSITMEIQDVPAIVAAARKYSKDIVVALDNTYAAGVLFDAFGCGGVDVSVQALTKFIGGHSDILQGSFSVANESLYNRVGPVHRNFGMAVSPDDCSLALRGLQTLAIRLAHLETAGLRVAQWCQQQPAVERVLHPAMESGIGHEIWKRDWTGSASLFSIVFYEKYKPYVKQFVNSLDLFRIGFSWGGVSSLALSYDLKKTKFSHTYGGRLVRLYIGLEDTDELIDDLRSAFDNLESLISN